MHSLSVVEVVITSYLHMGGREEEMLTWKCRQWTFQRGSAFGMKANSCSAAASDANVSVPPLCVLFPSATVALSQSLLLNSQVKKDLSV